MTAKNKMLEKCLESIQNNDPDLMEDKIVHVELDCGTTIVLDVKFVKSTTVKNLKLVSNG